MVMRNFLQFFKNCLAFAKNDSSLFALQSFIFCENETERKARTLTFDTREFSKYSYLKSTFIWILICVFVRPSNWAFHSCAPLSRMWIATASIVLVFINSALIMNLTDELEILEKRLHFELGFCVRVWFQAWSFFFFFFNLYLFYYLFIYSFICSFDFWGLNFSLFRCFSWGSLLFDVYN